MEGNVTSIRTAKKLRTKVPLNDIERDYIIESLVRDNIELTDRLEAVESNLLKLIQLLKDEGDVIVSSEA